jgi:hypothetical protein
MRLESDEKAKLSEVIISVSLNGKLKCQLHNFVVITGLTKSILIILSLAGTHSGSVGQVDANRRRDLGENHRLREESSRRKGIRSRSRSNSQRLRRRLRRHAVSVVDLTSLKISFREMIAI